MAEAAQKLDPLAIEIGMLSHDPLGFVMFCFPWGVEGTSLAQKEGPEPWQRDILESIRLQLEADRTPDVSQVIRLAVAAGHGVGKSALVSWIILWVLATFRDARGVVTANTSNQLETKTWPELAKWARLAVFADWFSITANAISSTEVGRERTWRIDAVPWTLNNAEAFAGLHNEGKRIFVAFDEASAIPDLIWETAEGAMTDRDTEIIWAVFGNPTRNTGRFRECWGRFRDRWPIRRQVDGRDVSLTDKAEIAKWAKDYGDDSDFFRIRVKGEFPRGGSMQFIDGDTVDAAMKRQVTTNLREALVMGVDVSRFGADQTVIYFRRGREGRYLPPLKFRGLDTMQVAARVAEAAQRERPQGIFVDETGLGAGVVDRLRQMRVPNVIGVNFGGKADRLILEEGQPGSANKRAEMWASMRTWLKGGAIPNDPELQADLTGVEYGYNDKQEIVLEKKEHMVKRGLSSPDIGDALALTFAYPVMDLPDQHDGMRYDEDSVVSGSRVASDYDPMAELDQ